MDGLDAGLSRWRVRLGAGLLAALAALAQPCAAAADDDRTLAARIEAYLAQAVPVERFSGAVLVARHGQVVFNQAYGWANVELEVPNTPDTVFRLASVTKPFTAAAILRLQEQGLLDVDDPLCQHLDPCPEAWRPVTLRQLLTMSAGIPGVNARELGPVRGLPVPMDQWFDATRAKPLDFVPGSRFGYSNAGYALLGLVIEKRSGLPYGEFLQQAFFGPLGMIRSGYEDPLRIIKNRATGYQQLPGDPITNVPYRELVRLYAAGGVYATTGDLLRWDRALAEGRVLSPRSVALMHTPGHEMIPGKRYAMGWWERWRHGRRELAHGGNLAGFITSFARYPDDGVTLIVLSNNGRGSSGAISDALGDLVFGAEPTPPREWVEVPIDAARLPAFVGRYEATLPPTHFDVTLEGGRLMVQEAGYPKSPLHAASDRVFFQKDADLQFHFEPDAAGVVTAVTVRQGDSTLFERIAARKRR